MANPCVLPFTPRGGRHHVCVPLALLRLGVGHSSNLSHLLLLSFRRPECHGTLPLQQGSGFCRSELACSESDQESGCFLIGARVLPIFSFPRPVPNLLPGENGVGQRVWHFRAYLHGKKTWLKTAVKTRQLGFNLIWSVIARKLPVFSSFPPKHRELRDPLVKAPSDNLLSLTGRNRQVQLGPCGAGSPER